MPLGGFLRPVGGSAVEGANSATHRPAVSPAGTGETSPAGRASYVRPTPTPPAPRFVLDDADAGLGIDWARRAAQAVVAHARFMDWVERPSAPNAGPAPESAGTDHASAVRAYDEFSGPANA